MYQKINQMFKKKVVKQKEAIKIEHMLNKSRTYALLSVYNKTYVKRRLNFYIKLNYETTHLKGRCHEI